MTRMLTTKPRLYKYMGAWYCDSDQGQGYIKRGAAYISAWAAYVVWLNRPHYLQA